MVTQGSIKIKLSPPKSSKYLYPINDYENFEFKSVINPWNPQTKYKADFDKIKCLEIVLTPGKLLYIPAYWWYTFKFNENTSVSCFKYRTYMNNIAISPKIFMYALQNQNVERKIVKKLDITESSPNNMNSDTTSIDNLSNNEAINNEVNNGLNNDTNDNEIPQILIPNEKEDNLAHLELESLVNTRYENKVVGSSI
jgi:ribosomal protein L16 Arg81 hydroxylase